MKDGDGNMTDAKTKRKPHPDDRAAQKAPPPPIPLCRYEELAMRENRAREAAARAETEGE